MRMPLLRTLIAGVITLTTFSYTAPFTAAISLTTTPPPKAQPDMSPARLFDQGMAALSRKEYGPAEESFQKSLALDPNFTGSLLALAEIAMNKNSSRDEAWQYLQRALSASPESSQVHTAIGRLYHAEGKFEQAESALIKAVELDPQNFAANLDLGTFYMQLHKVQQALEPLKQAVSSNPKHGGARFAYGSALSQDGKENEALVELEEAAKLVPDNPMPYQAMGLLYARKSDFTKANAMFDKALAINPNLVPALMHKGEVFLSLNQPEQAIPLFQKVLKIDSSNAIALLKRGLAQEMMKSWNEAFDSINQAITLNPALAKIADVHYHLGLIHKARGEQDKAIASLTKASELDENHQQAKLALHQLQQSQKQ
jgi:tetratricopeptide (TPR) repeat protein